jgi:hypothetical protein
VQAVCSELFGGELSVAPDKICCHHHHHRNNNNNNNIGNSHVEKLQMAATLGTARILRKALMQKCKTFSIENNITYTMSSIFHRDPNIFWFWGLPMVCGPLSLRYELEKLELGRICFLKYLGFALSVLFLQRFVLIYSSPTLYI